MLTDKQIEKVKKNHNGTLLLENLNWVKSDEKYNWSENYDGSKTYCKHTVLHCYTSGRFWTIDDEIERIILKEEETFGKLLDKWLPQLPEKLSAEEAFFLITTKGVPYDIISIKVDDFERLDILMEKHKLDSKNSKFKKEIF